MVLVFLAVVLIIASQGSARRRGEEGKSTQEIFVWLEAVTQAVRKFDSTVLSLGFTRCEHDSCVYVKGDDALYLLLYVEIASRDAAARVEDSQPYLLFLKRKAK